MDDLSETILNDLKAVGLPTNYNLVLKPYSKSYNGRYNPANRNLILYLYEDVECTQRYPYHHLIEIAVHEAIHALQFDQVDFIRHKNIMHDVEFHKLNYVYQNRMKARLFLRENVSYERKVFAKAY